LSDRRADKSKVEPNEEPNPPFYLSALRSDKSKVEPNEEPKVEPNEEPKLPQFTNQKQIRNKSETP
jgi:hypothetical protein